MWRTFLKREKSIHQLCSPTIETIGLLPIVSRGRGGKATTRESKSRRRKGVIGPLLRRLWQRNIVLMGKTRRRRFCRIDKMSSLRLSLPIVLLLLLRWQHLDLTVFGSNCLHSHFGLLRRPHCPFAIQRNKLPIRKGEKMHKTCTRRRIWFGMPCQIHFFVDDGTSLLCCLVLC